MTGKNSFPFAAVVGQPEAKQALLIAAVNPKAGGVLLTGEKGTAKSTLIRGLAGLLAPLRLIELPLNATEDMVFGSIDIKQAITQGERVVTPGVLARADGNVLYVDELNLMRREIVNGILDAAAAGVQLVEREGLSGRLPARFVLLGSMNPEEGMLPPQLLDRFGMTVAVGGEREPLLRVEIIRRRLAYEADASALIRQYRGDSERLKAQLKAAMRLLPQVELSEAVIVLAAQLCSQARCSGHRAELFLLEAAKAIAALGERTYVLPDDIARAAQFVLPHRTNQDDGAVSAAAQSGSGSRAEQPEQSQASGENQAQGNEQNQPEQERQLPGEMQADTDASGGTDGERTADIGAVPAIGKLAIPVRDRQARQGSGKRSLTQSTAKLGRYVRAAQSRTAAADLAFDATLRAAAPYQRTRPPTGGITVYRQDWRKKIREKRIGSTFLFVVDASGSMGARQRMKAVKGTVLALLTDAYQKRDRVGLIAFRREKAEVLLPVTGSVDLAQKCLQHLPTGGKTPLAQGLVLAAEVLGTLRRREKELQPVIVLVTDGRANSGGGPAGAVEAALAAARCLGDTGVYSLVIDTEQEFIKLGIAAKIAGSLGGAYYKLEELSAQSIIQVVTRLR